METGESVKESASILHVRVPIGEIKGDYDSVIVLALTIKEEV